MPNNFQPHVPDFQRGERLSAARLNELADAIARLLWHKQQASNATFGVKTPLEIIGKLDEDLPAAADFGTTPGEAVMSVWFKDQNGNLIDSGRNENIKQRFESAEAKAAGDEVRAAWIEGEWVALPGGGSGGRVTSVRFKIVSSDPTTLSGLATILAWDYGFAKTAIPATIVGNTVIEICDPMGCFLNEPNVDLTDRAGVAVYRESDVPDNCRTGYVPFPGVWEVTSLCCKLLSCDVVI